MTSLESVLSECAPALLGYFIRRVESPDDAADLVNESMIAAWKASHRMPQEGTEARMWLFGVARNTLSHHSRAARRRDALVMCLAQTLVIRGIEDESIDTSNAIDIRGAVSQLPPPLAELIRLVHWDGFSIEQAAEHLDLRPSTARGRYARAKVLLRESLESLRVLA